MTDSQHKTWGEPAASGAQQPWPEMSDWQKRLGVESGHDTWSVPTQPGPKTSDGWRTSSWSKGEPAAPEWHKNEEKDYGHYDAPMCGGLIDGPISGQGEATGFSSGVSWMRNQQVVAFPEWDKTLSKECGTDVYFSSH